jgi:uncharacterized lipoprotein YehR (DUF1307 family)
MIARQATLAGFVMVAAISLTACQSTQEKSAELAAEAGTTLLNEKGLKVTKESTDVKVTSTAVLSGSEGSAAVVVDVHNDSSQNLVDVPILIDVRDAKGKSLYRNDFPGIEPALAEIPYVAAGGDAEWVNDQVLTTGKPSSVKVKLGADDSTFSGELPDIEVSEPHLAGDPVSGIEATGTVVNKTGTDQGRLLIYVVARRRGEVIAAGRGAIEHLKPETKKIDYRVFFVGDPRGGELTLSDFPTLKVGESRCPTWAPRPP